MSLALGFLIYASPFVLIAMAWMCGRKASYHRGAEMAYRQVANDFRGLADATWFRDEAVKKAERRKRMLNLCLCDPNVCDALAEALAEAREYWKHPTETAA